MKVTQASIARDWLLADPERRELPTRTVARALQKAHPQVWPTVDKARGTVKYVRGLGGDAERRKIKGRATAVERKPGWMQDELPRNLSDRRVPFRIKGPVTVGVLSDIHVPYHDMTAVEIAVKHLKKRKPEVIYLNGDTADFYGVSRHQKDPRKVNVAAEIDAVRQFLFWLRKRFPTQRIIYKIGNHEERLEKYLATNAPVLLGVMDFELDRLLRFEELQIERVDSRQFGYLGRLPIIHGHEMAKGHGVNPARWAFLKAAQTIMLGHFHRTSEHVDATGLSRKVTVCHSTGCLCDLNPEYLPVNQWNHGFAIVEVDAKGRHRTENLKIVDGEVF